MNENRIVQWIFLTATLVLLTGAGVSRAASPEVESPDTVLLDTGQPVMIDLIRRELGDPDDAYQDTDGRSDCRNQAIFRSTHEALSNYVARPEANQAALTQYLLSNKDQCDCAEAIIGKYFNTLLQDLGPDTARYRTCLDLPGRHKAQPG